AFLALPVAYLFGLLRSRYARAGTVSDLLAALSSRAALRDTLARALGDPSLHLVYWAGRWVDREGRPVELPQHGVKEVERDGERIGALVHDPALDDQPELVEAVAAAAALALENERLEAELRARVLELQESRAKLIEASMAERRRPERDPHDGAHHARVSVQRQNGHAVIEVLDDGVGGADPDAGTGLRGLADRLTIVDGRLEVLSPPGKGTLIRAQIPCV